MGSRPMEMTSAASPPATEAPRQAFQRCYIPNELPLDDTFAPYISRQPGPLNISRPYKPLPGECSEVPVSPGPPREPSYVSFGENGTTASITDMGQLMQFCSYLGLGHSSVFSADTPRLDEPYMERFRAETLQLMCRERDGYGLDALSPWDGTEWDDEEDFEIKRMFLRDRWPVLIVSCARWEMELRCIVHKGVVIQQYFLKNKSDKPLDFVCTFKTKILIRDLDHVDPHYNFNEDDDVENYRRDDVIEDGQSKINDEDLEDSKPAMAYSQSAGPNGYGLVRVHKLPPEPEDSSRRVWKPWYCPREDSMEDTESDHTPNDSEAVGVVTGVFINGNALKWEDFKSEEEDDNKKSQEITVLPHTNVEVTAGYKLVLLSSQRMDLESVMMSAAEVDCDRILAETSSAYVDEDVLDYPTRRNVEHILSVCSIPVAPSYVLKSTTATGMPRQSWMIQPIAITCGDISGHRVSTSSSFFAFKLLTSIAQYLSGHRLYKDDKENPLRKLRERIMHTCRGHLMWVFNQLEIEDNRFGSEYWPSGRKIKDPDPPPAIAPTNTPFQILKAFEYHQICDTDDSDFVAELLEGEVARSAFEWLKQLDKDNKRDCYAWRHSIRTDIGTFRLDDHAWLWNALKAMDIILRWKHPRTRSRKPPNDVTSKDPSASRPRKREEVDPEEASELRLKKKYDPEKVRREMIQRFTTENDHFKQRMLAFTRSAREDRFVLHSRDTVLFYPLAGTFLTSDVEVWNSTLDAQKDQKENQDMEVDNPLRYALVVLLGRQNFLINRAEMSAERARSILDESRLSNGLYPGRLDESTKKEKHFDYVYTRDFYLHVSFEIPYMLWMSKLGISLQIPPVKEHPRVLSPESPQEQFQEKHQRRLSTGPPDFSAGEGTEGALNLEIGLPRAGQSKIISLTTGKISSNAFINSQNVVEVSEEWLYDWPLFLDHEPPALAKPWKDFLEEHNPGEFGKFMDDAVREVTVRMKNDPEIYEDPSIKDDQMDKPYSISYGSVLPGRITSNIVLDFAKKRTHGKSAASLRWSESSAPEASFWYRLSRKREPDAAKKRLIWLREASSDSAIVCILAAHEQEKEPVSLFFERHVNFEKYFSDQAIRIRNTWETEFHISFLQVSSMDEILRSPDSGILKAKRENLPDIEGRLLVRASTGFRFHGDFMDRFWTCHFIQFIPHDRPPDIPTDDITNFRSQNWNRNQRKILELALYCLILGEANRSTDEILKIIKGRTNKETERLMSSKDLDSKVLSQSTLDLGAHGQVLEALEQDLGQILENITDWENRERDRQQERPRWTKADERKHGSEVNKFSVLSRRRTREMRGHLTNVRVLKTSANSIQDRIRYEQDRIRNEQDRYRNEQERLGNENIRYFTYATVFFLPLSFAVSVYSMQAPPPHELVVDMAKVAVIGIAITVTALAAMQWITTIRSRKNEAFASKYAATTARISKKLHKSKEHDAVGSTNASEAAHASGRWKIWESRFRGRIRGGAGETSSEDKDLESQKDGGSKPGSIKVKEV